MTDDWEIRSLLANCYPAWVKSTAIIQSAGNAGGFSGARIWRIETEGSTFALRRWPDSDTKFETRLRWSHLVLRESVGNGCHFVPVPLPAANGESLVLYDGTFWQLEPWMPGIADFEKRPTDIRLENAVKALAIFHQSTRHLSSNSGIPGSIVGRKQRLKNWYVDGRFTKAFGSLQQLVSGNAGLAYPGEIICRQFRLLADSIEENLTRIGKWHVAIQPVIGDVWHDHILLTGDEVTGIIDFGAMKNDTVALDLGRLIGSLVGDDREGWRTAIEAYRSIQPLSETGISMARILDSSGTALAGLNWLHWICVENRQFGTPQIVFNRLQGIALRMERLSQKL